MSVPRVLPIVALLLGAVSPGFAADPDSILLDLGRTQPVHAVAFSPDGSRLAVVDDKGRLDVFTLADKTSTSLADKGIQVVRFTRDSQRIIAGDEGQPLKFLDILPIVGGDIKR